MSSTAGLQCDACERGRHCSRDSDGSRTRRHRRRGFPLCRSRGTQQDARGCRGAAVVRDPGDRPVSGYRATVPGCGHGTDGGIAVGIRKLRRCGSSKMASDHPFAGAAWPVAEPADPGDALCSPPGCVRGGGYQRATLSGSSITGFSRMPMFSISTRTTSPACIHRGGLRWTPTPRPVPVRRMSPGSSVKQLERTAI